MQDDFTGSQTLHAVAPVSHTHDHAVRAIAIKEQRQTFGAGIGMAGEAVGLEMFHIGLGLSSKQAQL